ncbi:non-structural protein NS4A [Methanolobus chelungpuianus]|nr:non-structural protein NS4A [Methanolobus chelungpuianus]
MELVMAQSVNKGSGSFAHALQSIPDFSEILVLLLIMALLAMSSDEVVDFFDIVRGVFTYSVSP